MTWSLPLRPIPLWPGDRLRRMAAGSIAVAIVVTGLKYWAYRATGSVAFYSDALESIVNVVTASIALWAVIYASRPPDTNHPFGHHKAEYVSAVLSGAMVIVAALLILEEAWSAYRVPQPLHAGYQGVMLNGLATLINAGWASRLIARGRAWRSPALAADGWHVFTDVTTSLGVLAGYGLATMTGWQGIDGLTALAVAVSILWSGWGVVRQSFSGLMDEAVPDDMLAGIRADIRAIILAEGGRQTEGHLHAEGGPPAGVGALEAHDLRTRHAGRATFIEFHLVVSGDMPVRTAHGICDRIEAALRARVEGARVTIHVEPEEKAKHTGATVV